MIITSLRRIIDGDATATITREEAVDLHSQLWDLRTQVGALEGHLTVARRKVEALNGENNALVAQVVSEERRAVRAEIDRAEALEIIRDGVDEVNNPKRWRLRAREWLLRIPHR